MRSAGREPDQDVSGSDPAPVDRPRFLDDADRESGEVVFAGNESLRMLGGLAAGQRASGQLAALRNAADHFAGDSDVERFADVVVEKEQRLGALDQNVVDAHRDQVDPDGIVLVHRERELELGADAVGPGDEHRLAVALRQLHQCTESTDAGQNLRPQRALGERLDGIDQAVAGIDVDARIAIRKRSAGDARRGTQRSLSRARGSLGGNLD